MKTTKHLSSCPSPCELSAYDHSLLYLWTKRTLYIGEISELSAVNQAAASFIVSLENHIEFWTEGMGKPVKTHAALIPAGQAGISANAFSLPVAVCYLDPFLQDYSAFKTVFSKCIDGIYYELNGIDQIQKTIKQYS
ncbi:MAG: hypothetical protein MI976_11945 [Pseudomonadales bacterium]|nr:hypothetical protein [Pseudomonadales bacterium]